MVNLRSLYVGAAGAGALSLLTFFNVGCKDSDSSCEENDDCTSAGLLFCQTNSNTCVQCLENNNCNKENEVCKDDVCAVSKTGDCYDDATGGFLVDTTACATAPIVAGFCDGAGTCAVDPAKTGDCYDDATGGFLVDTTVCATAPIVAGLCNGAGTCEVDPDKTGDCYDDATGASVNDETVVCSTDTIVVDAGLCNGDEGACAVNPAKTGVCYDDATGGFLVDTTACATDLIPIENGLCNGAGTCEVDPDKIGVCYNVATGAPLDACVACDSPNETPEPDVCSEWLWESSSSDDTQIGRCRNGRCSCADWRKGPSANTDYCESCALPYVAVDRRPDNTRACCIPESETCI